MIKIMQFVPVQVTVFLVLGIYVGYFFTPINSTSLFFVLVGLLCLLFYQYKLANKSFNQSLYFNFTTYIISFLVGVSTITIHTDSNNDAHYSHFVDSENSLVLQVDKVLKPGNYYNKYVARITQIDGSKSNGKILLNVQIDSFPLLDVDTQFYVKSNLKELIPPMNPYYFNYKEYLKKQNIQHQIFTSNLEVLVLNKEVFTLKGYASRLRKIINKSLVNSGFKGDELAVMNALLLGQRQDISPELLQSYTGAGAIHILAVSGLHVGIILLILNFLFKPVEHFKNGKFIKLFLVLLLLWAYAFVAGLSASVVRAVTMFTAVAIGLQLNKPTNVYNTLTISMFFLLLFNPYFLFDVGFQLSYLAVFSIVWIQPLLYKMYKPKWKIVNFYWNLLTVSVAAQFGIIPVSLYYFHQFPSLFFISNLVIIPFLGVILMGGILMICLALLNFLPEFLVIVYSWFIQFMNATVDWVAHQEAYLFKNVSFSLLMIVNSYIFIVFGIRFLERRTAKRLLIFCVAVLLFQSTLIYEKYELVNSDELIVFHKSRFSMLGNRTGNHLEVFHSLDSLTFSKDKVLNQYKIGVGGIEVSIKETIPNIHQFKNKKMLIVDSLGVYQVFGFKPEIVLLQQSPKINLVRLIDSIQPKIIIADGSNYKSYINRWEKTCELQKTPFHYTGQKGAFVLK